MSGITQLHVGIRIKMCDSILKNWVKNEHKNPSHLKTRLKGDMAALHIWMETEEVTLMILIHENELNAKLRILK